MRGRPTYLVSPPFVRIWLLSLAGGVGGFQLFPSAPLRLAELGAPPAAAGAFLAALTFASAVAAAWTGAVGDRLGRRRVLTGAGLALAGLSALYAVPLPWPLFVALAVPHGAIWSALLTAGSAEAARLVPVERRAEGIAYHGLAMTLAIALAPSLGLALAARSWGTVCIGLVLAHLAVAALARGLPPDAPVGRAELAELATSRAIEWSVLRLSSVLLLSTVGYGGATSFVALLSRERGVAQEGIFFSGFAAAVFALRPLLGPWVDRVGPLRALPPCMVAVAAALAWLPHQESAAGFLAGGALMGAGFSTLYPAFSAWVLQQVPAARRGAAFGAMLAAFDVGIGSGSLAFGPLVDRFGYQVPFLAAAGLALLGWPLLALGSRRWRGSPD